MKKTSLYINPDVDRALARRASAQGVTKAEMIRGILAEAVEGTQPRPTRFGVFRSARGDLARRADEHLAESGFGET